MGSKSTSRSSAWSVASGRLAASQKGLGLHVAVDNARPVGGGERVASLQEDVLRLRRSDGPTRDARGEVLTAEELHGDPRRAAGGIDARAHDVLALDARADPRLALEALARRPPYRLRRAAERSRTRPRRSAPA